MLFYTIFEFYIVNTGMVYNENCTIYLKENEAQLFFSMLVTFFNYFIFLLTRCKLDCNHLKL